MTDSLTVEQKKSRRGVLALVGGGAAAAVAALLGRNGKGEAATYTWTSSDGDATGQFNNIGAGAGVKGDAVSGAGVKGNAVSGIGVYGTSSSDRGVYGWSSSGYGVNGSSSSSNGVRGSSVTSDGVRGSSGSGTGVKGEGKPGVYGVSNKNNGAGVRGDGDAPGSIGVFAKNTPGRRALRTKGKVQMDCARATTVSAKSTKVTLPAGVRADTNAVIMATVQGNPGNDAVIWRAYRADSTHIRIVFNEAPANPVSVAYWVVHTG